MPSDHDIGTVSCDAITKHLGNPTHPVHPTHPLHPKPTLILIGDDDHEPSGPADCLMREATPLNRRVLSTT